LKSQNPYSVANLKISGRNPKVTHKVRQAVSVHIYTGRQTVNQTEFIPRVAKVVMHVTTSFGFSRAGITGQLFPDIEGDLRRESI